jgi:hypothetical protein
VAVDDGQREVPRYAEQDPLLQDLLQLLAALLQRRRVRVDPGRPLDLAMEGAVVRQDLIMRVAERGGDVPGDQVGNRTGPLLLARPHA